MNVVRAAFIAAMAVLTLSPAHAQDTATAPSNVYEFTVKTIDGKDKPLSQYKGKVLLIVNTASECHFTGQYAGLEELYKEYRRKGFEVLAFPSNDFKNQEPGTDKDIKKFCLTKYKTTFQLFSKISVRGDGAHPLYKYLSSNGPSSGGVTWNFNKFLIDRHGHVAARFASRTEPTAPEIQTKIKELLDQK